MPRFTYHLAFRKVIATCVFVLPVFFCMVTACSEEEPPEPREIAQNWDRSKDPQVVKCRHIMSVPVLYESLITGGQYPNKYGPGSIHEAARAYQTLFQNTGLLEDVEKCKKLVVPRKVMKDLNFALYIINSLAKY
jgi:hypothetical protein